MGESAIVSGICIIFSNNKGGGEMWGETRKKKRSKPHLFVPLATIVNETLCPSLSFSTSLTAYWKILKWAANLIG